MSQQNGKKQSGWLQGLFGFGAEKQGTDTNTQEQRPTVRAQGQAHQAAPQPRLPSPRRKSTPVKRSGVAKDIFGEENTPDVLMESPKGSSGALMSDIKEPKGISGQRPGVPTRLSSRMRLAMKTQTEGEQTSGEKDKAAVDFTDPAKIKEQLEKLIPAHGIAQAEKKPQDPSEARPFRGDPFADLLEEDANVSIGSAAQKRLLDYKAGDEQKVSNGLPDKREAKPSETEKPENLDNQYRGKIKPIKVKMGRKMNADEIQRREETITEDKEEQRNPIANKEISRDLGTLAFLRMQEEFEQAIQNKAPLPSYIEDKNGPANNYGLDAPAIATTPKPQQPVYKAEEQKPAKAKLPEPKPIPAPQNKQFGNASQSMASPNRIDTTAIESKAVSPDSKAKVNFLNAPSQPAIVSQSEIEASSLSDAKKSEEFKKKINSEKQTFKPLQNKVLTKGSEPVLEFEQALEAVKPEPATEDLSKEFEQWVNDVERACPPLYKREPRLQKREPSEKIKRNLAYLPVAGRSVAFSTLINSWSRMSGADKARAMVIQPDFVRLDDKEFLDHEIFMGSTHLPTYRTHGLYKAKSDICGPLAGKAIHLSRPIVSIEPNESVESSIAKRPELLKRTFAEPAFSRWNEKGANYGSTLLDDMVQSSLPKLTRIARMTMKNAALLARSLYSEFQGHAQAAQDDPGFNLRFLEKNGFLPSDTLYLFLEVPCLVKTEVGTKSYPLWQAILKDPKLSFSQVQIENMPAEMLMLHLIATIAEMPSCDLNLIRMMAIADKLIRLGDYNISNEVFQKSVDAEENKSFAVLKAFETIVSRDDKSEEALDRHKLGAYRIVQCVEESQAEEADDFSQATFEHIQLTHSGLKQQMVAAGLWRSDVELVIRSNAMVNSTY